MFGRHPNGPDSSFAVSQHRGAEPHRILHVSSDSKWLDAADQIREHGFGERSLGRGRQEQRLAQDRPACPTGRVDDNLFPHTEVLILTAQTGPIWFAEQVLLALAAYRDETFSSVRFGTSACGSSIKR